eukprot:scaffold15633_cov60-Phaeocystis_antarctica.AAC.18
MVSSRLAQPLGSTGCSSRPVRTRRGRERAPLASGPKRAKQARSSGVSRSKRACTSVPACCMCAPAPGCSQHGRAPNTAPRRARGSAGRAAAPPPLQSSRLPPASATAPP